MGTTSMEAAMMRSATRFVFALLLVGLLTAAAIAHVTEHSRLLSPKQLSEIGGARPDPNPPVCDCDWKVLLCEESPYCYQKGISECSGDAGSCCQGDTTSYDSCGPNRPMYVIVEWLQDASCGNYKDTPICQWSDRWNKCICVGFPGTISSLLPIYSLSDRCASPSD